MFDHKPGILRVFKCLENGMVEKTNLKVCCAALHGSGVKS